MRFSHKDLSLRNNYLAILTAAVKQLEAGALFYECV